MDRRRFLSSVVLPLVVPESGGSPQSARPSGSFEEFLVGLAGANDRNLAVLLDRQERRAGHRWLGGFQDETGIHTAGGTASLIASGAASYCTPTSRYSKSPELLARMEQASRCLIASQHEDGTIDLHTTNFHSPPDTGFVVEPLAAAYSLLRLASVADNRELLEWLEIFLRRAGNALAVGGVHTPNHRWVVCAAMARINRLFPNRKYEARIGEWLAEGIDIDPDGQYSEKSAAIYSPLTNRMLLTIAGLTQRPELFEPVRRNLEMTLYYLHADGEIVTTASLRQDQYTRGSSAGYYLPARYMAIQDKNGRFASFCRRIEEQLGDRLSGSLVYLLEEPIYRRPLPDPVALPDDFTRHYRHSGLVRIRRGAVSATLAADNPVFFSLHKGSAALQGLRLASAFFGKGQFRSEALEVDGDTWRLHQNLIGPYYQPLAPEARRPQGPWTGMNQAARRQSETQSLSTRVTIREDAGRFEVQFDLTGCERVPVAVEFGFGRGGTLSGVTPLEGTPDAFMMGEGAATYSFDGQTIEFGPGLCEHRWTQLRGALPKQDASSVYLTGFTPFRRKIVIS